MSIAQVPANYRPIDATGQLQPEWVLFLKALAGFPAAYQVAGLPASAMPGSVVYASDGRKPGETAGHGTGVPVYWDSTNAWISFHSGVAVTA